MQPIIDMLRVFLHHICFRRFSRILLLGYFCLFIFELQVVAEKIDSGDDTYSLMSQDLVEVRTFGEDDLSVETRVDTAGKIRIPLIGNVIVKELTIRQAEKRVEKAFVDARILRKPQVTIRVLEYATRKISILGQVKSPGDVEFPREVGSMDIVEAISKVGGFSAIAKSDRVLITRTVVNKSGERTQEKFTVDVEDMISGRRSRGGEEDVGFKLYPGDVVFVPERLF